MNLAQSKEQRFLEGMERLGAVEITFKQAETVSKALGMSNGYLRKMLSTLEKMDKLVRLDRGVYMTMKGYRGTNGGVTR
jgi:predicted transcriptional regulator of viral defense system